MDKMKFNNKVLYANGEYRIKSAAMKLITHLRKHKFPARLIARKTGYQVYTVPEAYNHMEEF